MAKQSFNDSKSSNYSGCDLFEPLQHSQSTVICLVVMAVVIFVENITVCALFATNKRLRVTTNVFVISLAISDIFVAVLFVPVYLATPVGHVANMYMVTFLLFTSLFNLGGVTYDRYHAILQPLTYRTVFTSWRVAALLGAIWLLPLIFIVLPYTWSAEDVETELVISRFYLGFMVFIVFLSCVVITKVYFGIFKAIRRQLRMTRHVKGMFGPSTDLSSNTSIEPSTYDSTLSSLHAESPTLNRPSTASPDARPSSQAAVDLGELEAINKSSGGAPKKRRRRSRFRNYSEKVLNDFRAVKLLAVIILVFIICWLPAIIINFMIAIDKMLLIPHFIFDVSVYSFVANAILNPLLFTFYKRDYRRALLKIVSCRFRDVQKRSVMNRDAMVLMVN